MDRFTVRVELKVPEDSYSEQDLEREVRRRFWDTDMPEDDFEIMLIKATHVTQVWAHPI